MCTKTERRKRIVVLGTVAVLAAVSISISASQNLTTSALVAAELEVVKDNLYVITGSSPLDREAFSGGNTGVFVADEGVTIVDTKLPGWGHVILEKIRTVTDKPVIRIINTHTHGDHNGSNSFFPETVSIVAHENARTRMSEMEVFQGENAKFLPSQIYQGNLTIGSGSDRIELYHFGRGHTDGDTFILYPALGVLQTGDMFPWRDAPFLDRNNGGSGVEFPRTLSRVLNELDGIETVIPGHIPVTTWAELQKYQSFTAHLLQFVETAKASGQSADDVVSSIDVPSRYEGYESNRVEAAVRVIYEEIP